MFKFSEFLEKKEALIIAEFANALEGNKEIAIEMIDKAVEANVDALKFQMIFADELLVPDHPKYNLFKDLECSRQDWSEIFEYAGNTNKLIFVDVFGEKSLEFSKNFKIDAYKISPTDMNNYTFINNVSSVGIPMVLSAGACSMEEIEHGIHICHENGLSDYAIMHGFQNYPTKLEDVNLNVIKTLESKFGCPVGYADHVDGGSEMALIMPLLALAKGAKLIEKHFTLDRDLKGIDYQSSVNPDILKKLVYLSQDAITSFGDYEKVLSTDEIKYKKEVRKRIVSKNDLKSGHTISTEDITFKRGESGIFADELERIIGKRLIQDLKRNKVLTEDNIRW